MIEFATLAVFCALLLWCVLFGFSILYALAAGLVLFWLYGRCKGFAWAELFKLSLNGVKTVKNILITFVLIGMLTAVIILFPHLKTDLVMDLETVKVR